MAQQVKQIKPKVTNIESDTFQLVFKEKSFKLSLTEKIDATYLSKILNISADDIIGFQRQDGLLIQLSNTNLLKLIGGRTIALNVNEPEEKTQENDSNTYPSNMQIAQFHSNNDWGDTATRKMNEWLEVQKDEIRVLDVKRQYTISDKHGGLYWWFVRYSKKR